MHQMAFQCREENIINTLQFKLIVDYKVSPQRLGTLQVRDLDFPASPMGEIQLPPEFQPPEEDGDDPGAKALREADALVAACKQTLRRAGGEIRFDGAPPSTTGRKRKVTTDVNKETQGPGTPRETAS